MKSWKLSPVHSQVAKYVENYWFLEREQTDILHEQPKLYPDPTSHLIITNTEQKFQYEHGSLSQKGYGNHWILPHRKTYTMDHSEPFKILGIKFRIGALYSLQLPFPAPELEKIENVDLKRVIGFETIDTESLLNSPEEDLHKVCNVLDETLLPWLSLSKKDQHSDLVREIAPLLDTKSIAEIATLLHRSRRTIERSFLTVTQLTLKQYQSMIRLEAILEHLFKLDGNTVNWVDLAAKFEFSDQPHFIRYLKSLIDKTPGEYARNRDLTIDIYGDFELN